MSEVTLHRSEEGRERLLRVTRRRAGALLGAVTVVFVASTVFRRDASWLSWVQAASVASMVGGLADWFAVTALFRRPLGLPIPHTAIIVERKDRFAQTLGSFVAESFFNTDSVMNRVDSTEAIPRAARWLSDSANSALVASQLAELLGGAIGALDDAETADLLSTTVRTRVDGVALAPLAGRALEALTRDSRHEAVLGAACGALGGWLSSNGMALHARLGARSPWWLPGPVNQRLVARMLSRLASVLTDMSADPSHPARIQLDEAIATLASRLQSDPQLIERGEELKAELLGAPELRVLTRTIWSELVGEVRSQTADPDSALRRRIALAVSNAGAKLARDPAAAREAQRTLRAAVSYTLEHFGADFAGLVTGTIERWDGAEASKRLELLLGPDLQYIRINGTVIGGLAGLALHALSALLG